MNESIYIASKIVISVVFLAFCFLYLIYIQKVKNIKIKVLLFSILTFTILASFAQIAEIIAFWNENLFYSAIIYFLIAIISISLLIIFLNKSSLIYSTFFSKISFFRLKNILLKLNNANKEFKESEIILKKIVENNPDIITLIGKNLKYKFISSSALKLRKNEFSNYEGKSIFEIMFYDYDKAKNEIFTHYVQETFKTKEKQTFVLDFHSNETVILSFNIFPLDFDSDGNVENVMSICKDITEQKRTENLLNKQIIELSYAKNEIFESKNIFKKLVENNPDTVSLIDKDLKYSFISSSALTLKESLFSNYIGKSIFELAVSKEDKERSKIFEKYVLAAFETKQLQEFEYDLILDTKQKVFLSFKVFPLDYDALGNVETVMSICKNITQNKENETLINQKISELKALNSNLKQKQESLQDFSYIVSHNLRSPLANLTALFEFLKEETNPEIKDLMLEKIEESFKKLSESVSDLTAIVEIKNDTKIESINLNFEQILKDQILSLKTQIKESDAIIEFDFSICENINYPKVYLSSIMLNLLTNALKYRSLERKTYIKFETKFNEKNTICLTCTDNGLGIDLEKHGKKLFGLNKTFHKHADARGVGLFITKNQIEALGGSISVESEVNKGTTFTINFNRKK